MKVWELIAELNKFPAGATVEITRPNEQGEPLAPSYLFRLEDDTPPEESFVTIRTKKA